MDEDRKMAVENPAAYIEKTIRRLNSEKLALGHKVESLQKGVQHQTDLVKKLSSETVNLKAEHQRLLKRGKEYAEKREGLELAVAGLDYKTRFLSHMSTENEQLVASCKEKIEDGKTLSEMLDIGISHTEMIKKTIGKENKNLKQRAEFLEESVQKLNDQIQSLSSSVEIRKGELLEGGNKLVAAKAFHCQLKERAESTKRRVGHLKAARTDQDLQLKELKNQFETLSQQEVQLTEEMGAKEAEFQDLTLSKNQLEVDVKEFLSENEILANENGILEEKVQSSKKSVESLQNSLLKLKLDNKLEKERILNVTESNENLEKRNATLTLECEQLDQSQKELKEVLRNSRTALDSATQSNLKLAQDLQLHKNNIASLVAKEQRSKEENAALAAKLVSTEEAFRQDVEILRNDLNIRTQAEAALEYSLESLKGDLLSRKTQIEDQTKEMEADSLGIRSLQIECSLLQEKSESLKKEGQRLLDVESQNLEEIQMKCKEMEALSSAKETLLLENEGYRNGLDAAVATLSHLNLELQSSTNESEIWKSNLEKAQEVLQEKVAELQASGEKFQSQSQRVECLKSAEENLRCGNSELKIQLKDIESQVAAKERSLMESLEKAKELENQLKLCSDSSTEHVVRHGELSAALQTLIETSSENEEAHVAEIAALRAAVNSADYNANLERDRLGKELDSARTICQNLRTDLESTKRKLLEADALKTKQEAALGRCAMETQRQTKSLTDARSHLESLDSGLKDKLSQLQKIRENHLRLLSEKENADHQLTVYMAKNQEQEDTIKDLRQDINDMAFNAPANPSSTSSAKTPVKKFDYLSASKSKPQSQETFKKGETKKPASYMEKGALTPRKQLSAPDAAPKTVSFSPVKLFRSENPSSTVFAESSSDFSMNLSSDDEEMPLQAKALGTGLALAGKTTDKAAAKSAKQELPKGSKFFRTRRN